MLVGFESFLKNDGHHDQRADRIRVQGDGSQRDWTPKAIILFEQRLHERLRALAASYVEPDGPCVRFDSQRKPQKATTLTFGIDHDHDQAQRFRCRCELKPISGCDLDGLQRQPCDTSQ
jgi:hypothetical protein